MEGQDAAASAAVPTLVASKTTIPMLRADNLVRPRLMSMMSGSHTPLTLAVAPAGWGKTTLLAQWARDEVGAHPVGWLTLDASDNVSHRFWTYVITALRRGGSPLGEPALAVLGVPGLDPIEVAIPHLLNDLAGTDQPHTIVIDDYHLIDDQQIREGVEYLVTYLPATARLVLGSRVDPPLPLALWRGRGMLTEIRADQLRFDVDETAELLSQVEAIKMDRDQAVVFVERTEGWAAGLQLVAMAVRSADDPARKATAIRGDHRHLIDYVSSEILGALTDSQRDLMVRASVLDRLSAELCRRALGIENAAELLEQLELVDPFITRLDENGTWYRWHPIVRDALRRELERSDPDQPPLVLSRAAGWYIDRGEPEPAIRHLILAGDSERAVELLLLHEDDFLDGGNIGTFLALAETLGPEAIRGHPMLGVSMAWALVADGRVDRVKELLDLTEAALKGGESPPAGWLSLPGSISTLRAMVGYASSSTLGAAESYGHEAIAAESDPSMPGYSVARFALGLVLVAQGRLEDALTNLEESWSRSDIIGMPVFARLPIAGVLALCLLDLGRNDDARAVLVELFPVTRRLEEGLGAAAGPAIGGLRMAAGRLELEEGDLDRARQTLAMAVDMIRVAGHPSQTVRALTLLAEAEIEAGDSVAARTAVSEAREIARSDPIFPATTALLDAIEVRVGRSAVRVARSDRRLFEDLTDRELSILRALDGPLSQREIGRELHLSINTVKGYAKSLYRKLDVASRADAVQRARELGIV